MNEPEAKNEASAGQSELNVGLCQHPRAWWRFNKMSTYDSLYPLAKTMLIPLLLFDIFITVANIIVHYLPIRY